MDSPPMVLAEARSPVVMRSDARRPRVAVLPERYGNVLSPCASIRLFSYFDRMRQSGQADLRFMLPSEIERFAPDIIVWHRIALPDVSSVLGLHALARRVGARLIYDLDDNLLDMEGHDEKDSYAAMTAAVSESLACADEVWCSTPDLARRIARQGSEQIQVLPNTLDPELWQLDVAPRNATREASPLRMLYMGTRTHDQDFAFLHAVMERLHGEAPGAFQLTLIGVRSRDDAMPPWLRVLNPPGHVGASYPAFVHWLVQQGEIDLGLAPLMSNPFNDCKSPIKVLDYAALGLPALASEMPAYTHSLTSEVECFHATNRVDAWCEAIQRVGSRPQLRGQILRNARALVDPAVFESGVSLRLARIRSLSVPG